MKKEIDKEYLLELLKIRIKDLDTSMPKRGIEAFIADASVLDFWSQDFFMTIIEKIQFKS